MSHSLEALLQQGRTQKVWDHAAVCVVRNEQIVQSCGDIDRAFDVASVTKAVTAVAVWQRHDPAQTIEWLPTKPTVGELLSHASGLPAWRPLFAHAAQELGLTTAQLAADKSRRETVRAIYQRVIASSPTNAPRPTYSDLGFLALGFLLEEAEPLATTFARLLGHPVEQPHMSAQPTGIGRPRAGNPNIEQALIDAAGVDPTARDNGPDDDNAACAGGLCGHAGLFTSARTLALWGDRIRQDSEDDRARLLPRDAAQALFTKVCGDRTMGWDTPGGSSPSIGTRLGRGPKGAAGHLGFTGCSLWVDRDAKVSVALLTDAVRKARPAPAMRMFRPAIHDAIAAAAGL